jgi:hypothetical protein
LNTLETCWGATKKVWCDGEKKGSKSKAQSFAMKLSTKNILWENN